ncbi:MAG TPA: enoyl-CoA hydratase-related protein [Anaeromyxobacteraceae bacterium]|nr:enoyl-CoA hydratase-related protein [Anaeromyxobacteraceae bacterium]
MARLRAEDRGPVRLLTLDHPKKRNALDFGSLGELTEACLEAARDRVRCLVFRGAGELAFCSGFDIAAIPVAPGEGERPDLSVERAIDAVAAVPCPTIAFLNGSAFGAGAELAAACDLRVARPGVAIGMPPARLGVVYAPGGLRRFVHLVGPSRAREMFFTARPVEADEALAIGLVDRVVPADAAEAAALALAEEIAMNAPLAVQGMKRILQLLDAGAERAFTEEERREVAHLRRRAFESDDVREGRAAFLEKRPPRFKGT